jgi:predicted RNase H-like HicB family nuclease
MKTIVAIIEKASDGGYGIYSNDIEGGIGSGLTEQEAREDFLEVVEEQAEHTKEESGQYPDWYTEGYTVDFQYDFSGFFKSFPFINISAFAKAVGINPSLMRRYKQGLAFASEKQKSVIQTKFNDIMNQMSAVQF